MGAAGLTSAHADLAVGRGAEVTEEALVWVAGITLCAQFSQLLGADAAAAAAVQHQAHSGRAARGRFGCALTLRAAVLAGGRLRRGRGGRSVCDLSSLCPPSFPSVNPGAYPGAEGEEHQGEADGTRDGGEHGRGEAGGRTAGCRGDEGCGRSLDSESGRRLVSGRSRRWRLGLSAGLGLLPSGGGGLSPGVGAGADLAESSWREELCEAGRAALAFIRSRQPARQRTEWSPTQTGTFLAFLPTFLPHQLTPD